MPWRYQPVFRELNGERSYSLCEVYFDDAGNLTGWTENEAIAAGGSEIADLTGDLAHMLVDALAFEPVLFSALKPGLTFTRRISMEERNKLADVVEGISAAPRRPVNRPASL